MSMPAHELLQPRSWSALACSCVEAAAVAVAALSWAAAHDILKGEQDVTRRVEVPGVRRAAVRVLADGAAAARAGAAAMTDVTVESSSHHGRPSCAAPAEPGRWLLCWSSDVIT
jgi:hypothetical protein